MRGREYGAGGVGVERMKVSWVLRLFQNGTKKRSKVNKPGNLLYSVVLLIGTPDYLRSKFLNDLLKHIKQRIST